MTDPRYWVCDSPDPVNRIDEASAAVGFVCGGLVDEDAGGIIAYGHPTELERIVAILNTERAR